MLSITITELYFMDTEFDEKERPQKLKTTMEYAHK